MVVDMLVFYSVMTINYCGIDFYEECVYTSTNVKL